ncbi:unnamed protein product [Linum trigynum]|uniref:Uncharacterized protein n=1 Tax=Linum trigynum TaxID=586398 RepID=A0AAV2EUE0_9ROSI
MHRISLARIESRRDGGEVLGEDLEVHNLSSNRIPNFFPTTRSTMRRRTPPNSTSSIWRYYPVSVSDSHPIRCDETQFEELPKLQITGIELPRQGFRPSERNKEIDLSDC